MSVLGKRSSGARLLALDSIPNFFDPGGRSEHARTQQFRRLQSLCNDGRLNKRSLLELLDERRKHDDTLGAEFIMHIGSWLEQHSDDQEEWDFGYLCDAFNAVQERERDRAMRVRYVRYPL